MSEKTQEKNPIGKRIIAETFAKMDENNQLSLIYTKDPTIYLINLPAGFRGEEEVHEKEDDMYYVFKGSAELMIDENSSGNFRKLDIKEGDFVHIPSKIVHKLAYAEKGVQYIVIKIPRN